MTDARTRAAEREFRRTRATEDLDVWLRSLERSGGSTIDFSNDAHALELAYVALDRFDEDGVMNLGPWLDSDDPTLEEEQDAIRKLLDECGSPVNSADLSFLSHARPEDGVREFIFIYYPGMTRELAKSIVQAFWRCGWPEGLVDAAQSELHTGSNMWRFGNRNDFTHDLDDYSYFSGGESAIRQVLARASRQIDFTFAGVDLKRVLSEELEAAIAGDSGYNQAADAFSFEDLGISVLAFGVFVHDLDKPRAHRERTEPSRGPVVGLIYYVGDPLYRMTDYATRANLYRAIVYRLTDEAPCQVMIDDRGGLRTFDEAVSFFDEIMTSRDEPGRLSYEEVKSDRICWLPWWVWRHSAPALPRGGPPDLVLRTTSLIVDAGADSGPVPPTILAPKYRA